MTKELLENANFELLINNEEKEEWVFKYEKNKKIPVTIDPKLLFISKKMHF